MKQIVRDSFIMVKKILFPVISIWLTMGVFQIQAQIINIEDRRSVFTDSTQWFESLDLNFNVVKNTKQVMSISGALQLEFAFRNKLLLSLTKLNFVKGGNEQFVNDGFQHLRYNSRITDGLTFEVYAQAQFNEQANIKLRTLAGSGLRIKLIRKEKERAFLGLSYMYEYEEENIELTHDHANRISSYLAFTLNPLETLRIVSTSYYQPNIAELQDFRVSSETTAFIRISERFSFKSSYSISFDARAPMGAPNTIYSFLNGLRYRF